MPLVNGHQAECGCYVEGHWGQYGPDHLADQAEGFGWEPGEVDDDPREMRAIAEDPDNPEDVQADYWQRHSEAADDIEAWLNDHTEDGYSWGWFDGEFYLWSTESWEEA